MKGVIASCTSGQNRAAKRDEGELFLKENRCPRPSAAQPIPDLTAVHDFDVGRFPPALLAKVVRHGLLKDRQAWRLVPTLLWPSLHLATRQMTELP